MELQEEKQTNEKQRRFGLELLDFVKILLVCFIVAFGIKTFIARPVFVEGSSMYPTLQDGEFGFTNLLGLSFEGVNRGDIVIVEEGDEYWVKRVIACPMRRSNAGTMSSTSTERRWMNHIWTAIMCMTSKIIRDISPVTLRRSSWAAMNTS